MRNQTARRSEPAVLQCQAKGEKVYFTFVLENCTMFQVPSNKIILSHTSFITANWNHLEHEQQTTRTQIRPTIHDPRRNSAWRSCF